MKVVFKHGVQLVEMIICVFGKCNQQYTKDIIIFTHLNNIL